MRLVTAALLSVALVAPGLAFAADVPPEAAPVLENVKTHMRVQRNINFRKIKVSAAGDVCGMVAVGSGRDMEFLVTKTNSQIWINEAESEPNSAFNYGDPNVRRSTERADFQTWKACQKG